MKHYKKGQIVTLRRKVIDVTHRPFTFKREPMVVQIKELTDENFINSPCDFCEAAYCHCGFECKLEGTSLFYKKLG